MIYFIADTHFGHKNILKYCNRPFRTVDEMNSALVRNWNNLVKPGDTVFFLGDWSFGRGARTAEYWARRLNGNIITISGSHDKKGKLNSSEIVNYGHSRFLVIHDPQQIPKDWTGWVIHGHKHNNDLANYPFINGQRKTINVSVETIGYRPVSIDRLLKLNLDTIDYMQTINTEPIRQKRHYVRPLHRVAHKPARLRLVPAQVIVVRR